MCATVPPRTHPFEAVREMNAVEFLAVQTQHSYGAGLQILIDGQDLIALVREIEFGLVISKGDTASAGSYSGLPAKDYLPPSRHFWGEEGKEWWDGKSELLTCGRCGNVACWPLIARITTTQSQIIWSDFEQPHRNELVCGSESWRYTGLGPFTFNRAQYEATLLGVARSVRELDHF